MCIRDSSKELGQKAAQHVGKVLRECIQEKGEARIVLSTGASQLDTLEALIQENVDWSKVETVSYTHLDVYKRQDKQYLTVRRSMRYNGAGATKRKKVRTVDFCDTPVSYTHLAS